VPPAAGSGLSFCRLNPGTLYSVITHRFFPTVGDYITESSQNESESFLEFLKGHYLKKLIYTYTGPETKKLLFALA
jgi:hypothetical protein